VTDQLVITEPEGTVCVPAATLARIVIRAAERAEGARVRHPRRGVDVEVAGGSATVTLRLAARYGTVLPQLAEDVQRHVASALEQMCGVEVRRVDLAIEELV
jgi:Asp23 family, cell envelope-related function